MSLLSTDKITTMAAVDELNQAPRINREKYLRLQERLRAAQAPEAVSQYTVAEHQAILSGLYKESEVLSREYRCLNKKLIKPRL
jgi:hypothetical protein